MIVCYSEQLQLVNTYLPLGNTRLNDGDSKTYWNEFGYFPNSVKEVNSAAFKSRRAFITFPKTFTAHKMC